ncbi:unnamed protein product [Cyclocybe aegerita]|uniref:YEATS domain-containing protein n=1 Tax=Cyclocybe aegerita TaxID=1973307 RepID=A0A8S0WA00_CYCAE|nr:unnamed protein product [Cyclocybe aegerita]
MSPPKRRKLDRKPLDDAEEPFAGPLLSDINAEIGIEIALRQRLLDTVQSRITWAVLLQESLQQQANGSASSETFRNVALDTLSIIEAPSNCILSRDPIPPPSAVQRAPRPPPRKNLMPNHAKSKPSFLYIGSSALHHPNEASSRPNFYLLKCPRCSRTTFTSLQGLLNHARLTHNLEWGTHDECIRACAAPCDDLEVDCGIEVGTGPTGVLPALRTIFQLAVGGQGSAEKDVTVTIQQPDSAMNTSSTAPPTTHLNKTLGLHENSPALAPFLGKEPIRRQIKVVNGNADVDIETTNESGVTAKRGWRLPFTHRNFELNAESESQDLSPESDTPSQLDRMKASSTVSAQTRFYIISRIVITDGSMWIPPEKRTPEHQEYTHKWMISVDSPSYTHHITTLLESLKVTASDSSLSMPAIPVVTSPPFVVFGFSDRPFLARIDLSFCGTPSQGKQIHVFYHWVDLDPIHTSQVVMGEEQMVDVELDKNTAVKPPQLNYTPGLSKSLWNMPVNGNSSRGVQAKQDEGGDALEICSDADDENILSKIAKQFPMTRKDIKGPRPQGVDLPYFLASDPMHFKSLVVGRRKAIEWARARAVQLAYNEVVQKDNQQPSICLSVGDVYSWMSEHHHFHRSQPPIVKEDPNTLSSFNGEPPTWCRICGLEAKLHRIRNIVKSEASVQETEFKRESISSPAASPTTCLECPFSPQTLQVPKLSKVDIHQLLFRSCESSQRRAQRFPDPILCDGKALVSSADPHLTLSIRKLVETTRSVNPADAPHSLFPISELGDDAKEVEKALAPHALLSLLTRPFIHTLIRRGLAASDRDKATSVATPSTSRTTRKADSKLTRLLTPRHILSGILTRGPEAAQDPLDDVLRTCLSKLGVAVDDDLPAPSRQGESGVRVKTEEELVSLSSMNPASL